MTAIEVRMPRLSDSMETGTIVRWLVADGAEVRPGDELVEIETDKATMVYEADGGGSLSIVAPEGATLDVGDVIARLGDGSPPVSASSPVEDGSSARDAATAQQKRAPRAVAAEARPAVPTGPANGRVKASPVARRVALDLGLDLGDIQGSGPAGRIVKADVQAAAAAREPAPAPAPRLEAATGKGDVTELVPTRAQQVVARRMVESQQTIPAFTLETEIDMENAVELRSQLREAAVEAPGPSYNDLVVKACALALREHPRVNGSHQEGRVELYSRVNVGVAVAVPETLMVPTIFDADTKSVLAIAAETRALAARARDGTITPPELSGGTFTVSNLGMHGVTRFTAIINPPQAAILAVGSLVEHPAVVDGALAVRHRMRVTLACDHRLLNGADGAAFLGTVRDLLEQPLRLLLA